MARRKTRARDGLYKRENGIMAFRYKHTDGGWKEKYTGTTDRPQAKTFRHEFLSQVENGTLPTQMAEWTLDQARDWWLGFRKPRIAPSTLTAERYRLKPMIKIIGNVRLKEMNNLKIDTYVTKRLENGCAPWSINKEVLTWSMILRKAKCWRRIVEDYKPLKTQVSDIGRALTREQLRARPRISSGIQH